ncbi:hypothetical protein D2E25_0958 [Bifidobacterium goeldii]|uniref:DUF4244 domain-containing protein n=1 Tax=Bifidobacterium goeldii TaxID=2306975 RepID=A0A430FL52_9BIFI|nr:DUF4244 domain-containing protein [Bifidobacterium goeldii]RSX53635.1 hypothetical protein D2E25_0958 [Bifidobacterium goeldii]
MNINEDLIGINGRNGPFTCIRRGCKAAASKMRNVACMVDARLRMVSEEPEEGAATAEYALVLIAATGFAGLLATILKSDVIVNILTEVIKKALSIG